MKKILSGALAVLAIATTLAVCVSANDGKSLNKSYTYSPVEGVDYTVYYDIGSILPYDDVRGRTKILLYADKGESEGYAIGLCSEFSVNAYPHGKTVHILRSSEPEAEAEPPPMAARSVLDRLA